MLAKPKSRPPGPRSPLSRPRSAPTSLTRGSSPPLSRAWRHCERRRRGLAIGMGLTSQKKFPSTPGEIPTFTNTRGTMATSRTLSALGRMGGPAVKARMLMWLAGNKRRHSKENATGMTLLELLVVITILSLMAGLVAPRIGSWLDIWRLRSAADRITQTLRYARTRALFEQHFYVVEIFPGKRTVRVLQTNSGTVQEFLLPEG